MSSKKTLGFFEKLVHSDYRPVSILFVFSILAIGGASIAISKIGQPSLYDENLYKDRLRRSTIQLIIIACLGLIFSIVSIFFNAKMNISILLIISILMTAVTSDMVNSFTKVSGDSSDAGMVKTPIAILLTLSLLMFVYSSWRIKKEYFGNKDEKEDEKEEEDITSYLIKESSLANTKLDFHSNFINF